MYELLIYYLWKTNILLSNKRLVLRSLPLVFCWLHQLSFCKLLLHLKPLQLQTHPRYLLRTLIDYAVLCYSLVMCNLLLWSLKQDTLAYQTLRTFKGLSSVISITILLWHIYLFNSHRKYLSLIIISPHSGIHQVMTMQKYTVFGDPTP